MSISLPDKIETETKQSVDNCLLDRVATVDLRLVSEIHTQRQLLLVVFLSFRNSLSSELLVIDSTWILFDMCVHMCFVIFSVFLM